MKGYCGRGQPKKELLNCMKDDVYKMEVNSDMSNDEDEWRKRT